MVIIGFIIFFLFLLLFFYSTVDWKEKEERKKIEELCYQELVDQEKKNKGLAFEQQITEMVTEKLKGAFVINNCILNKKNKEGNDIYWNGTIASKEFDIIILSKKGLFVIEAKNYAQAFISGNLNDKTWLTSYSKSKIFQVYSPMKQVTEGVLTLKRYLPDFNFKKLVVFPDSTKVSDNLKKSGQVLSLSELRWFLNNLNKEEDLLSKESIVLIKDLLVEENERARKTNAELEHLKYVQKCKNEVTA